jgi:hypothetical protein
MPQDPALLKFGSPVEKGTPLPRPSCRECGEGHISFDSPVESENGSSVDARSFWAWEPEWIRGAFTSTGTCQNTDCGLKVAVSGTYEVYGARLVIDEDDPGPPYSTYYTFRNFSPPLQLMRLPESTPEQVKDGVDRAATVLFADPGLAATALRLVVEQFLTADGIPDKRARGGFISADERIMTWKGAAPGRDRVANLLLAVKWIGNAGTHSLATLSVDEVLAGAEFLSEAFHALFEGPSIDARAQAINQARGPVRRIVP